MTMKLIIATAAATATALTIATPASAGPPAARACLGEFFSASASEFGDGFGQNIVFFAQNAQEIGLRNLGEGIQILQSGTSLIYPTVCQPD